MSLLETVRNALTPGISLPMVTLFPGGPIGNEVGLNTSPGQDAVPEPQVQDSESSLAPSGKDSGKTPVRFPDPDRAHRTPAIGDTRNPAPGASAVPDTRHVDPDTSLRGAVGTANFAGFIRDLGEYNADAALGRGCEGGLTGL
jgi:hypothetical protein